MRLILIYGVFILFYCRECISNENAIFIYDKIDTSNYDKTLLIQNIGRISIRLSNEDKLDFHFKIIFPHRSSIVDISGSSAKEYPDFSRIRQSPMRILLTWLQHSPTNSVFYVMTNNTTPTLDHDLLQNVIDHIQIKRAQVNFIIMLNQSLQLRHVEEYRLITAISSGFILTSSHFKNQQFSDVMHSFLIDVHHKVNVLTVDNNVTGEYCINDADSLLNNPTVILMHNEEYLNRIKISASRRSEIQIPLDYTLIVIRKYVNVFPSNKAIVSVFPPSLQICFEFVNKNPSGWKSPSFYGLRAFGTSELNFNYGFTTYDVSSSKDAHMRPVKDETNKIYVTSTNENYHPIFHHVELFFINGTSFGEKIPLYRVPNNTNLFVGSFRPPKEEYFYVQVIASIGGELITRMSSNAVKAANGFGDCENNPSHFSVNGKTGYLNWKMLFLLIASIGLITALLGQIIRYTVCWKKSPPPAQVTRSERQAVPNFYHPVGVYKAKENRVFLK